MTGLLRLLHILHTIGRYRLDRMLPKKGTPRALWPLLTFFKCYKKNDESRGKRLRLALESLGPVFVKFGQLLSTRPDLIPADICQELNYLQDQVQPFSNTVFKQIVIETLGGPIETVFSDYEDQALASASVAQVHAAVLKTGEHVVIKIVRPGIEDTIEKDISLLKTIAYLIEKFFPDGARFRVSEVVEDYHHTIIDELDLQREAANASILRRNFERSDKLYIPKVYWDYCSSNMMVMERIDGIPITNIAALKKQNTNMKKLAERGVEIFFSQVFEHNFFHADMHPGNIFVSREHPQTPSYIAVDMAIIGSLTREDRYYLARNMLAMFKRDYRLVAELHLSSGWVPPSTSLAGFEAAIRSVCEPVFEKPLKDISFGKSLIALFQTAQRYNMPVQPQLVLLQKTLLNIEGLGRQLYPELNLWDTAQPFLEKWTRDNFSPKALWRDFRHHGPEWMEKFPQVPHLIFDTLTETKSLAAIAPELRSAAETFNKQKTASRKQNTRKGILSLGAGISILWLGGTPITLEAASILGFALSAVGTIMLSRS